MDHLHTFATATWTIWLLQGTKKICNAKKYIYMNKTIKYTQIVMKNNKKKYNYEKNIHEEKYTIHINTDKIHKY